VKFGVEFIGNGMINWMRKWASVLPALFFLISIFFLALIDNGVRSLSPLSGAAWYSYYLQLITDPFYLEALFQTVALAFVTTTVCFIIGYPIAFYLVRHASTGRTIIIFLLITPLLTSIIMRTFGWRAIFARRGLLNETLQYIEFIEKPIDILNSSASALVGMVHVLVPFMVLSIAAVLEKIDPRIEEAAKVLGSSRLQTFLRITFPLSLDGVASGAILVFMLAIGSFVTLLFLGGGSLQTFPLLIYQQFNTTRDFGMAAAMSNMLMVLAAMLMFIQLRLIRRSGVA
jgi:putative spermidine/putrescine transport system permease protein